MVGLFSVSFSVIIILIWISVYEVIYIRLHFYNKVKIQLPVKIQFLLIEL